MTRRSKRIVISHWDLDGLAGATVFNRVMRIDRTFLSAITAITKYLLQAIRAIGSNGEIWISDLNPQRGQVPELRNMLVEARRRNIKIYWFDHHEWDKSVYDTIIGFEDVLWYRVDTLTTASELVARYFDIAEDRDIRRLLDLAFDDDFFLNRYELTIMWRRVLRWYDWPIRYKALESFIKGNYKPMWMIDLYNREVKTLYENLMREAIAHADTYYTRNGLKLIVFPDVDPKVHPGELVWIAKKNNLLADVYIIRYPRGISLRSDYIDVSMIAKMLGGGGHRNAAGIPGLTNIDEVLKLFKEKSEDNRKDVLGELI